MQDSSPLDYLFGLEFHGIKLGLENITRLLQAADNPQDSIPTVHVGGTNGKGSVIAFLDSTFRQAGYKTGRFTSPHLIDLNERFLLSGQPIPTSVLEKIIEKYRNIAQDLGITPTFFELNTAIAFQYFADQSVDIALIEVGMGGRFDSTNVITPLATVITNIGLDHTAYLGDTLEKIAFEKAGIIKPDVPLVLGETAPSPQKVITDRAHELNAPVHHVQDDSGVPQDLPLGLPGNYQANNAGMTLATIEILRPHFPRISKTAIREGLANTHWPCRFETVHQDPTILIDVAHNPQAAQALADALDEPAIFVIATANDKDAFQILHALAPKAHAFICTQFEGHRALPAEELASQSPTAIPHITEPKLEAAIDTALKQAGQTDSPIVIAGSLFTAGQARQILIQRDLATPLSF